jgi:four helix bundle protein
MTPVDLETRTTNFALRIIKLFSALPKTTEAQVLGKQLLSSGTSVGAHYREAKRAKSTLDFINKIEGALQELDETSYWLELIEKSGIISASRLASLRAEAIELTKILVTVVKRAKEKKK